MVFSIRFAMARLASRAVLVAYARSGSCSPQRAPLRALLAVSIWHIHYSRIVAGSLGLVGRSRCSSSWRQTQR
jgi:hypothetical protein